MYVLHLSPPLRELAEARWADYLSAAGQAGVSIELTPDEREAVLAVWACSEFVAQSCICQPALLEDLIRSGDLTRRYEDGHFSELLSRVSELAEDEEGLMVGLRRVRQREMVRIAWRDLAGRADLEEVEGSP